MRSKELCHEDLGKEKMGDVIGFLCGYLVYMGYIGILIGLCLCVCVCVCVLVCEKEVVCV